MMNPTFMDISVSAMQKGLLMKKNPRSISICNGRNTLAGILPKEGFIPRLIMQINSFFSDQRISGVYQSTKYVLSALSISIYINFHFN